MTEPIGRRATVINTLMDGTGRALQNVTVRIRLIAPGDPFLANGIGEVLADTPVDTDHDGQWSATLLLNSEIEQAGNYYLADERCAPHGSAWPFRLTDEGSTHWLSDLLIAVPPPGTDPPWSMALDDLSDVDTAGKQVGDHLAYGSNGQWIAQRAPLLGQSKTFSTPTKIWVFEHGLGRHPFPTTRDQNGKQFFGSVSWPDANTVRVEHGDPVIGTMEVT
jgi:hypothetical protein